MILRGAISDSSIFNVSDFTGNFVEIVDWLSCFIGIGVEVSSFASFSGLDSIPCRGLSRLERFREFFDELFVSFGVQEREIPFVVVIGGGLLSQIDWGEIVERGSLRLRAGLDETRDGPGVAFIGFGGIVGARICGD